MKTEYLLIILIFILIKKLKKIVKYSFEYHCIHKYPLFELFNNRKSNSQNKTDL